MACQYFLVFTLIFGSVTSQPFEIITELLMHGGLVELGMQSLGTMAFRRNRRLHPHGVSRQIQLLSLEDGVGSTAELLKLGAIVVGGFFFTLLTTAESVILVRRFTSNGEGKATNEVLVLEKEKKDAGVIPKQTTQNPFSERLIRRLQSWMVTSGLAALILSRYKSNGMISGLMTSIFMLITTLHNYAFGSRFPSEVRRIVHPLVTCTTMTWLVAWFFGMAKRVSFSTILKSYQIGNVAMNSGAGDLLLYMLGPMIISLSVSMYGRRKLLKDNLKEVAAAVSVTSMGTLFTTGAVVRLMGVNPRFRLSMVSRVVTPSLAISIANILNANVSIAVSAVVLTGLIGASFGTGVLDLVGIHDPIVRGLSMGACAHGLGTGAMVSEKDAFPFAAMAMALTAFASTVIVSIPVFQKALLKVTLGA